MKNNKLMKSMILTLAMLLLTNVYSDEVSESDATVEVKKAQKQLKKLLKDKKLAKYLPYRKTLEADRAYYNAAKYLDDSDYDEASYYAVLSYAASLTSRNRAIAWKAEVEMVKIELAITRWERDKYFEKIKGDKSWAVIDLQGAGLKRRGKSNSFKGTIQMKELLGFSRAPRNADAVNEIAASGRDKLDKIGKVLADQKKARVVIETWSSRERRRKTDISEAYAAKIKDYIVSKGVEDSRIEIKAKGKKRRKDIAVITISKLKLK